MDRNEVIRKITSDKVIVIVRGVEETQIIPALEALVEGGVSLVEVTFDHNGSAYIEETTKKIRMIVEYFGDRLCVGAGTVLSEEEVVKAVDAGAQYIISPNVDEKVIVKTLELEKVSIPGALTPTEAVFAHKIGADFIKLFPAGDLGSSYIKSMLSPLKHIPFIAVGGITPDNVQDFLDLGLCGVGVGGSIINKYSLEDKEKLTVLSKQLITHSR